MCSYLGYLGPKGTFTEEIALIYARDKDAPVLKELNGIDEVIEGVANGELEEGIVPLENSLEGSVDITLDMLVQNEVYIYKELIYPISHCLLVPPGVPLQDIQIVYSHSQALSQCRQYLKRILPEAARVPVDSTGAAAGKVAAREESAAAIAPARAASIFGLQILASDIHDGDGGEKNKNDNLTRFVVISNRDHPPTGRDKTSLIFSIKDGPGSLYGILGIFACRQINLTRIESRPSRRNLGEYLFFIDFQGHREENNIIDAMAALPEQVEFLKMLGSYPQELYEENTSS